MNATEALENFVSHSKSDCALIGAVHKMWVKGHKKTAIAMIKKIDLSISYIVKDSFSSWTLLEIMLRDYKEERAKKKKKENKEKADNKDKDNFEYSNWSGTFNESFINDIFRTFRISEKIFDSPYWRIQGQELQSSDEKVLGLTKPYTKEDARNAYIKMMKEHHPDNGGKEEFAKKINTAYQNIKDGM